MNDSRRRLPLTQKEILALAVPVMISNVSTPLLGVVDTAVVGRIPDPAYIGAVALGGLIFGFVFWAFGFLRMGTTGMTAQALGANDVPEIVAGLGRALLIAGGIGLALIVLQWPIRQIAFALLESGSQVESLSRSYFDIRIWSAPATLANYALLGWFIGLGRTKTGLLLQLILNVTNMALDLLFVFGLGWDVRGVATGTLIAEWVAAGAGVYVASRHIHSLGASWRGQSLIVSQKLRRTLSVNGDIMIRSLALISAFSWFTAAGARQGEVILAANAVLMQFVAVSAYFLDGIAFSTEALVGKAIGAANRAGLVVAARMTTASAAGIALLISAMIALIGPASIELMTVDPATRKAALEYLPWAAAGPVVGVWAFQLDGIFIGATRTIDMRNAMLVSLAIFLAGWWLLKPFGNHGLWGALYVHYFARIGSLYYYYPRLVASVPNYGPSTL